MRKLSAVMMPPQGNHRDTFFSICLVFTLLDKSSGGKFKSEFEDSSHKLQDFNECLGIEVNERKNLLEMLRQCRSYHTDKFVELQGLLKVRTH